MKKIPLWAHCALTLVTGGVWMIFLMVACMVNYLKK